jgi:short-subunit dehydrogenase
VFLHNLIAMSYSPPGSGRASPSQIWKIINIGSIVGAVPLRNQSAFAAAKAGVINLTKAWQSSCK